MMKSLPFLALSLLMAVQAFANMVFVANVDGNWDLFTVDDTGSHLIRLTETPYDEKDPAWSPDAQLIVYLTSDGQLNMMHVATRETTQVPTGDNNLRKYSPAFSPDGKAIIYAQARAGMSDDSDLIVFNLKSGTDERILDQHSIQMWPSFSPKGNMLAYANLHCNEACGRFIQELWVSSPIGAWAKQLLLTNSFCKQLAFSPDGKQIAYASDKDGNFDIWVLDLDNGLARQITTNENMDESPAWSPDGRKLAFVSNRSGVMEIWIKDIETGNLKKLKLFDDRDVFCRDVDW